MGWTPETMVEVEGLKIMLLTKIGLAGRLAMHLFKSNRLYLMYGY